MKKSVIFILLILIASIAIIFIIRSYNSKEIMSLIVLVEEKESPLDSLQLEKLDIQMEDRVLKANFLLKNETAPAIFICTGNGEALYEWLPVQKYLFDKGFSSYIFSYSGFGNSTGTPTETSLYEDALAAYNQFISVTPNSEKRIALSHSMGSAPLHGITNKMEPAPSKLIIHAPFSSIQQVLVEKEITSTTFQWLWPNIWNNIDYARDIRIPILYVHSKNDQTISYSHSQDLQQAAGDNATILLLEDFGHNAIYKNVSDSLYLPILDFINH